MVRGKDAGSGPYRLRYGRDRGRGIPPSSAARRPVLRSERSSSKARSPGAVVAWAGKPLVTAPLKLKDGTNRSRRSGFGDGGLERDHLHVMGEAGDLTRVEPARTDLERGRRAGRDRAAESFLQRP